MRRLLPLVLLALVAADARLGGVTFELPAGAELDGDQLTLADGTRVRHVAGGPAADLRAFARATAEGVSGGPWEQTWQEVAPGRLIGMLKGRRGIVAAAAIGGGGRGDLLIVRLGRSPDAGDVDAASAALAALLEAGEPGRLLLGNPTPQGDRLAGVWHGSRLHWPGAGRSAYTISRRWTFRPDGWCHAGLPPGGAAADLAALQRDHPADVGHYMIDGDTVRVTLANGETDELSLTDGGLLQDGALLLGRVDLPPDGHRFAGTLVTRHVTTATTDAGASTDVAVTLTFRPDGTVTRAGSAAASAGGDNYAAHARTDRAAAGTYAVAGGLLTITYPDGTTAGHPAHLADDGDGVTLWLDGDPLPDYAPANPLDLPR